MPGNNTQTLNIQKTATWFNNSGLDLLVPYLLSYAVGDLQSLNEFKEVTPTAEQIVQFKATRGYSLFKENFLKIYVEQNNLISSDQIPKAIPDTVKAEPDFEAILKSLFGTYNEALEQVMILAPVLRATLSDVLKEDIDLKKKLWPHFTHLVKSCFEYVEKEAPSVSNRAERVAALLKYPRQEKRFERELMFFNPELILDLVEDLLAHHSITKNLIDASICPPHFEKKWNSAFENTCKYLGLMQHCSLPSVIYLSSLYRSFNFHLLDGAGLDYTILPKADAENKPHSYLQEITIVKQNQSHWALICQNPYSHWPGAYLSEHARLKNIYGFMASKKWGSCDKELINFIENVRHYIKNKENVFKFTPPKKIVMYGVGNVPIRALSQKIVDVLQKRKNGKCYNALINSEGFGIFLETFKKKYNLEDYFLNKEQSTLFLQYVLSFYPNPHEKFLILQDSLIEAEIEINKEAINKTPRQKIMLLYRQFHFGFTFFKGAIENEVLKEVFVEKNYILADAIDHIQLNRHEGVWSYVAESTIKNLALNDVLKSAPANFKNKVDFHLAVKDAFVKHEVYHFQVVNKPVAPSKPGVNPDDEDSVHIFEDDLDYVNKNYKVLKNHFNEKTIPLIHLASIYNSLAIVKHLVEKEKININLKDWEGKTPLLIAAEYNAIGVVKYLIEQGADLTVLDNHRMGLLSFLAIHGQTDIVKVLLSDKCKAFQKNSWTGMFNGEFNGYSLRDQKSDDEYHPLPLKSGTGYFKNWAPIHFAVYYGHLELMKEFMKDAVGIVHHGEYREQKEIATDHEKVNLLDLAVISGNSEMLSAVFSTWKKHFVLFYMYKPYKMEIIKSAIENAIFYKKPRALHSWIDKCVALKCMDVFFMAIQEKDLFLADAMARVSNSTYPNLSLYFSKNSDGNTLLHLLAAEKHDREFASAITHLVVSAALEIREYRMTTRANRLRWNPDFFQKNITSLFLLGLGETMVSLALKKDNFPWIGELRQCLKLAANNASDLYVQGLFEQDDQALVKIVVDSVSDRIKLKNFGDDEKAYIAKCADVVPYMESEPENNPLHVALDYNRYAEVEQILLNVFKRFVDAKNHGQGEGEIAMEHYKKYLTDRCDWRGHTVIEHIEINQKRHDRKHKSFIFQVKDAFYDSGMELYYHYRWQQDLSVRLQNTKVCSTSFWFKFFSVSDLSNTFAAEGVRRFLVDKTFNLISGIAVQPAVTYVGAVGAGFVGKKIGQLGDKYYGNKNGECSKKLEGWGVSVGQNGMSWYFTLVAGTVGVTTRFVASSAGLIGANVVRIFFPNDIEFQGLFFAGAVDLTTCYGMMPPRANMPGLYPKCGDVLDEFCPKPISNFLIGGLKIVDKVDDGFYRAYNAVPMPINYVSSYLSGAFGANAFITLTMAVNNSFAVKVAGQVVGKVGEGINLLSKAHNKFVIQIKDQMELISLKVNSGSHQAIQRSSNLTQERLARRYEAEHDDEGYKKEVEAAELQFKKTRAGEAYEACVMGYQILKRLEIEIEVLKSAPVVDQAKVDEKQQALDESNAGKEKLWEAFTRLNQPGVVANVKLSIEELDRQTPKIIEEEKLRFKSLNSWEEQKNVIWHLKMNIALMEKSPDCNDEELAKLKKSLVEEEAKLPGLRQDLEEYNDPTVLEELDKWAADWEGKMPDVIKDAQIQFQQSREATAAWVAQYNLVKILEVELATVQKSKGVTLKQLREAQEKLADAKAKLELLEEIAREKDVSCVADEMKKKMEENNSKIDESILKMPDYKMLYQIGRHKALEAGGDFDGKKEDIAAKMTNSILEALDPFGNYSKEEREAQYYAILKEITDDLSSFKDIDLSSLKEVTGKDLLKAAKAKNRCRDNMAKTFEKRVGFKAAKCPKNLLNRLQYGTNELFYAVFGYEVFPKYAKHYGSKLTAKFIITTTAVVVAIAVAKYYGVPVKFSLAASTTGIAIGVAAGGSPDTTGSLQSILGRDILVVSYTFNGPDQQRPPAFANFSPNFETKALNLGLGQIAPTLVVDPIALSGLPPLPFTNSNIEKESSYFKDNLDNLTASGFGRLKAEDVPFSFVAHYNAAIQQYAEQREAAEAQAALDKQKAKEKAKLQAQIKAQKAPFVDEDPNVTMSYASATQTPIEKALGADVRLGHHELPPAIAGGLTALSKNTNLTKDDLTKLGQGAAAGMVVNGGIIYTVNAISKAAPCITPLINGVGVAGGVVLAGQALQAEANFKKNHPALSEEHEILITGGWFSKKEQDQLTDDAFKREEEANKNAKSLKERVKEDPWKAGFIGSSLFFLFGGLKSLSPKGPAVEVISAPKSVPPVHTVPPRPVIEGSIVKNVTSSVPVTPIIAKPLVSKPPIFPKPAAPTLPAPKPSILSKPSVPKPPVPKPSVSKTPAIYVTPQVNPAAHLGVIANTNLGMGMGTSVPTVGIKSGLGATESNIATANVLESTASVANVVKPPAPPVIGTATPMSTNSSSSLGIVTADAIAVPGVTIPNRLTGTIATEAKSFGGPGIGADSVRPITVPSGTSVSAVQPGVPILPKFAEPIIFSSGKQLGKNIDLNVPKTPFKAPEVGVAANSADFNLTASNTGALSEASKANEIEQNQVKAEAMFFSQDSQTFARKGNSNGELETAKVVNGYSVGSNWGNSSSSSSTSRRTYKDALTNSNGSGTMLDNGVARPHKLFPNIICKSGRMYMPTEKHEPKASNPTEAKWFQASVNPIKTYEEGQRLLDEAYADPVRKQLFHIYEMTDSRGRVQKKIIKFQPAGHNNEWHAYEVTKDFKNQVKDRILKQFRQNELITSHEYDQLIRGKCI